MIETLPPQGGFFVAANSGAVLARLRTDSIRAHLNGARELILESYEARDWDTLGYGSWREWATTEFPQHQRYLYYQLEAAQVEREICTTVQIGSIPERQLRPLTALDSPELRRVAWEEAVETAPNGKVTAAHVEAVVERHLAPSPMAVHYSSETPEWYTPPEIIARVVTLFGIIDLDPCADPGHNVPAVAHLTRADDGLLRAWSGRVYMNPPYGDAIAGWVEKLSAEVAGERVREAIALVPARTDTGWFQTIWNECAICFVRGRLKFSGNDNSAPFPSAVAYFGSRTNEFVAAFGDMGPVVARL